MTPPHNHALGPMMVPARVEARVEAAVEGREMGEHRGRKNMVDWRQGDGGEMIVPAAASLVCRVTWKDETNYERCLK